ncbi:MULTISPECIES: SpoIID/LytB domain-containing protein [Bacillaceae]|uniref:SpoIID/LytB domain-containing protein n=1 Tax=Evansella alkalicola TaxID=745819 RepID=A0ABS6JPF0_9BACI|nr:MULTISPECIES: SpoIID/LytB domain-containing protein [Bacillaceae]MBU9720142.1 SpoIID/LytB domain-containing protein [Bacillus alkalicola]
MKQKITSALLAFILIIVSFPFQYDVVHGQAHIQPNVSVRLVNYLGNMNEVTIRFTGNYFLNHNIAIESGKTYRLRNEGNTIVMLDGSNRLHTLNELTFTPRSYEDHLIFINNRPYQGTMRFVREGSFVRPINTLPVEDYLKGVVPSEMPASWNVEALKAQAVAARTYVAMQGAKVIDDTVNFQVYAGYAWHQNSTRAVNETSGQTLMHQGKYISAVYSSSNGGRTESNGNAWGGTNVSYLPVKQDPHDPVNPWNFTVHKNQIDIANLNLLTPENWWSQVKERDTAIANNLKSWLNNNGYPNSDIKIISVPTLRFSDQQTSGGRMRHGDITVQFYVRSLSNNSFVRNADGSIMLHTLQLTNTTSQRMRSMLGTSVVRSLFIDSVRDTGTSFVVNGRGFGHGVGMSQWGAKGMADKGFKVRDILEFYYPGTTLTPFIQYQAQAPAPVVEEERAVLKITDSRVEFDAKNHQVIVRYHLNRDAQVTITVRDAENKLVATLIRDVNRKSGNLSQFWTVTTIPNGTYDITIEAKDSGQTDLATVKHTLTHVEPQQPEVVQPVSQPSTQPVVAQPIVTQPTVTQSTTQPIQQPSVTQPPVTQPATQTVTQPKSTAPAVAKVGTRVTGRVNVNVANIRKSNSTSSQIVGKATRNQNVNILGRRGSFYEVQAGKVRGFIHVDLLTINQRLSANGQTAVVINGRVANVQGNPIVRNNTIYVPMKGVADTLKMNYTWNRSTNRITVRDKRSNIRMTVKSRTATVNGKNKKLTNAPIISNSRVYVSMRTLNETTNARTHWDSKRRIVWVSR